MFLCTRPLPQKDSQSSLSPERPIVDDVIAISLVSDLGLVDSWIRDEDPVGSVGAAAIMIATSYSLECDQGMQHAQVCEISGRACTTASSRQDSAPPVLPYPPGALKAACIETTCSRASEDLLLESASATGEAALPVM